MARHSYEREKFLEILATTPFINHACKKTGISRATIYRWMKDNVRFRQKVTKAVNRGRENLEEIAEMSLAKKIQGGDLGAIRFYLAHNSGRYRTKPMNSTDSEYTEKKGKQKSLLQEVSDAFVGPNGKIAISDKTFEEMMKKDAEKWKREDETNDFRKMR